jgi:tetratricopeptide (TPR) repeat protein
MILVLLLAFAAYVGSLGYDFVWDDPLVLQSPLFRDLRHLPHFLREDFSTLTSGVIEGAYYRPTLAISLALDSTLWGFRPGFFHLTNVLLHLGVLFLVARLAISMGAGRGVAILAALIFALHPVHVEAVVWIAARNDLLMSLGILGCLLAYRRATLPGFRGASWSVLALGAQVFALLSKELAVVLPPLLVLSDILPRPADGPGPSYRTWRRAIIRSLPFWMVTALFVAYRLPALAQLADQHRQAGGFLSRVPGALEILARYCLLIVFPVHMQPIYDLPRPSSLAAPWPFLGLLLLACLVILLIHWWRRVPLAAYGIAWFLVTVAPVVDLMPPFLRDMAMADRYLYLPSVGCCLLLAEILSGLIRPAALQGRALRKRAGWGIFILVLSLYAWSLLRYAPVWQSDVALSGRMAEVAPRSANVQFNAGLAYLRAGDSPRGLRGLQESIRLDPRLVRPRATLALLYVLQGRVNEGFRMFDALAAEGVTDRHYYIARIMAEAFAGEPDTAMAMAEDGARRFPEDAQLTLRFADALERAGRTAEAIEKYRRALTIQPDLVQAEEALGYLQAAAGQTALARQHFLRAAEMRPDRPQPVRGLALLSEAERNRTESLRLWRRVLQLASRGPAVQEALDHIRRLESESKGPAQSEDRGGGRQW